MIERAARRRRSAALHAMLDRRARRSSHRGGCERAAPQRCSTRSPIRGHASRRATTPHDRSAAPGHRAHASRHAARDRARRRFPGERRLRRSAAAADVLQGLIHPGARDQARRHSWPSRSFKEALDWLLDRGARHVSIQRYKGPGRDEPGAAVGDDDGSRRCGGCSRCRSRTPSRPTKSSATLMGEQVEPRRAFIETNALGVRNLDV